MRVAGVQTYVDWAGTWRFPVEDVVTVGGFLHELWSLFVLSAPETDSRAAQVLVLVAHVTRLAVQVVQHNNVAFHLRSTLYVAHAVVSTW